VVALQRIGRDARILMLHGLLRPDAVLVGGYVAGGHRCCPLASEVWEADDAEPVSVDAVREGIASLGLAEDGQRFVDAFDRWAGTAGFQVADSDGALVLTSDGRAQLISLVEGL
jgi:hypothetical protein